MGGGREEEEEPLEEDRQAEATLARLTGLTEIRERRP